MKKEAFVVFNPGKKNLSLIVKEMTKILPILEQSSHHRRRSLKGKTASVTVPAVHAVDLVKETGYTAMDVQLSPEVQAALKTNKLIVVNEANTERFKIGAPGTSVPVDVPEEVKEEVVPVEASVEPVEAPVEVTVEVSTKDSEEADADLLDAISGIKTALEEAAPAIIEEESVEHPDAVSSEDVIDESEIFADLEDTTEKKVTPKKKAVTKSPKKSKKKYGKR
jgi:hypothetical protein